MLIITPFTLAGAMAPVTIAGALTLAHAEALAGLTLAQIVKPGAPDRLRQLHLQRRHEIRIAGVRHAGVRQGRFGAGQLARFLGLPWRSSNATASNIPDAQSAYESQMSLWGALFGGCNFILHAAGWLESGLTTSYEKFILDIEMLQMFAEVFQPVGAAPSDLALEAVAEVGAGGHFFGCAHTMETIPQRVLRAAGVRLAQCRPVGRGRRQDGDRARQRHLAERIAALCCAGARSCHRRGAGLLCGAAQGRGRRAAGDLRMSRLDSHDGASGYVAVAISQVRKRVAS